MILDDVWLVVVKKKIESSFYSEEENVLEPEGKSTALLKEIQEHYGFFGGGEPHPPITPTRALAAARSLIRTKLPKSAPLHLPSTARAARSFCFYCSRVGRLHVGVDDWDDLLVEHKNESRLYKTQFPYLQLLWDFDYAASLGKCLRSSLGLWPPPLWGSNDVSPPLARHLGSDGAPSRGRLKLPRRLRLGV